MSAYLTFNNISVSRGHTLLFEGLSLTLSSGDVLWIQGTNGVGKTTLLYLSTGLARPDTGALTWYKDNMPVEASEVVSFQGHQDALKPQLTAFEDLSFWADLCEYSGDLEPVFHQIGLQSRKDVLTGKLSAGQKRRLSLARLLISQKPVWIMDEPSAVMDTAGRDLIDHLIHEHVSHGGCAIIASHSPARKLGVSPRLLTLNAESPSP